MWKSESGFHLRHVEQRFPATPLRISIAITDSPAAFYHALAQPHFAPRPRSCTNFRPQGNGVIAKRKGNLYEAGKRTGSWVKCRVNKGQELVIGGYIPRPHGFDSLIVGYYRGKDLMYVARVRNGFVAASRRQVFEKIRHLASPIMPFANLPDNHKSRWGDELTAEKMKTACGCSPRLLRRLNSWNGQRRID